MLLILTHSDIGEFIALDEASQLIVLTMLFALMFILHEICSLDSSLWQCSATKQEFTLFYFKQIQSQSLPVLGSASWQVHQQGPWQSVRS